MFCSHAHSAAAPFKFFKHQCKKIKLTDFLFDASNGALAKKCGLTVKRELHRKQTRKMTVALFEA